MIEYRYSLIRFIPDARRMEPTNVGLILQGNGQLDFKLYPHVSKRKDVNTEVFRLWREFLAEEIQGPPMPLFQPPKTSPVFLQYLSSLCDSTVVLSPSFQYNTVESLPFGRVLDSLYESLVVPLESLPSGRAPHPAGRFREISEDRRFLERGMKRHAHVMVENRPLWMAYRQVVNGQLLAIDKVEVNQRIGSTGNEIERLPLIRQHLPRLLAARPRTRFVLIADEITVPFSNQPDDEFQAMKDTLESEIKQLSQAGASVIRTVAEVENLANDIDPLLATPA